jgi:hypothetical protein
MAGSAKGARRQFIYYRCPHDPASPRDHATAPDHPVSVQAPQTRLDEITGRFFRDHVFTPGRAERLAAQLPVTDAQAAARTTQTAALKARIKKLDTAQAAQIKALEQIPDSLAAAAIRARIMDRFVELHDALPDILNPDQDGSHDTAAPEHATPLAPRRPWGH